MSQFPCLADCVTMMLIAIYWAIWSPHLLKFSVLSLIFIMKPHTVPEAQSAPISESFIELEAVYDSSKGENFIWPKVFLLNIFFSLVRI